MATYKVLQDIEAEDKLVGPLTLRQFIYAGVAALCGYVIFLLLAKGLWYLAIPFLPVIVLAGFFAFPWGRDQSTEIWALAKIRFLFKPRKRIWDQSGVKELVEITVPKRVERHYTDGLSEVEVRSRLHALADTIDSRGWAIKNVNVNMYGRQSTVLQIPSDRLVDASALPQDVPTYNLTASDDMFDAQNSPVAQHFTQMIEQSSTKHRSQIMQKLQEPSRPQAQADAQKPDFWFLDQNPTVNASVPDGMATFVSSQVVEPGSTVQQAPTAQTSDNEAAILQALADKEAAISVAHGRHEKTILPIAEQRKQQAAQQAVNAAYDDRSAPRHTQNKTVSVDKNAMTAAADAAILELARNNDLNVATLAREAKRSQEPPQDEVVISLR